MLKTIGLTKDYGHNRGAFDVDIEVLSGQILGFIGPNGAGKSTTMNMITGMTIPKSGTVSLFGQKLSGQDIQQVKDRMGVLYSEPVFPSHLTPKHIFQRGVRLRGLKDDSWDLLANRLEVDLNRPFGTLSLGNRKKVGVVMALMHKPDLVIVDEPTSGLDPLVQKHFLDLMVEVRNRGGAVLLSSHVLTEVESICDQISMIKGGKIIKQVGTQELIDSLPKVFRLSSPDERLLADIRSRASIDQEKTIGHEVRLYTNSPADVLEVLYKNKVSSFFVERPSLEEIFIEYYK